MKLVGIVIALVVVIGTTGMVVVAGPTSDAPPEFAENAKSGEAVSGAVAAGQAELEGEIEIRAFGHVLQEAESPQERADLIAERLAKDEETLEAIENRSEELEAELAAGNITHGQYLAELVRVSAQSSTVQQAMNQSIAASDGIEVELAERGVSLDDLEHARDRAHALAPGLSDDGPPGLSGDSPPGLPFDDDDGIIGSPDDPGNETEDLPLDDDDGVNLPDDVGNETEDILD